MPSVVATASESGVAASSGPVGTSALTESQQHFLERDIARYEKRKADQAAPADVRPIPLHALDNAPVNSKVVVVSQEDKPMAVISSPVGVHVLPTSDPANRLPVGARIFKKADDRYEAEQLNPAEDHPLLVGTTASEVIAGFIPHFHPLGGSH